MSMAIAGSEVAITVESMFSMNRATATMSGTRRSRVMDGSSPGTLCYPSSGCGGGLGRGSCGDSPIAKSPRLCTFSLECGPARGDPAFRCAPCATTVEAGALPMIYILAALLPPLGLLLNGQPFSALLNLVLIVPCLVFGLVFHVLLLLPSLHAVIAV